MEKVVVENTQCGLPIYVSRDGKVVEVPPEELRVETARL